MNDKKLEIIIKREKWQKVALAVGDRNPIHYSEEDAICPGIYLFSEVEKIARKDNKFEQPLNIKGKFMSRVYDSDTLSLTKDYSDDKLTFIYFNSRQEKVGEFILEKISDKVDYDFIGEIKAATDITKEGLSSFNEALEINGNESIYSAFTFGRILESFLTGREGALLHYIEFNHYKDLNLGSLSAKLDVSQKIRKKGRKEITDYVVKGETIQFGERIGIGIGRVQHKIVRDF